MQKTVKTQTLFVVAKMLQTQKKYGDNCKHQFRMFTNEIRTRDKPQTPKRAPARQKSTQQRGHQSTKDQQENVSTSFFFFKKDSPGSMPKMNNKDSKF